MPSLPASIASILPIASIRDLLRLDELPAEGDVDPAGFAEPDSALPFHVRAYPNGGRAWGNLGKRTAS